MQPGTEHPGSRGPRDDDYAPSAAGDASQGGRVAVGKPVRRARIGLLLLLAFMTEIIVIAAAGNQAVTDNLVDAPTDSVKGGLEASADTFAWRFSARPHDLFHVWAGGLALIGTTVVVSLLLILVLVRGPLTFWRAFFATWTAVVVATMLGGYVRALVIDTPDLSRHGIPARALFSEIAPSSFTFLGGVALGVVVALVVAVFGLATRRADETAPVAASDAGYSPGFYDDNREDEPRYGDAGYGTPEAGGAGYGGPGYGGPGYGGPGYGGPGYGGQRYGEDQGGYGYGTGYGTTSQPARGSVPWQETGGPAGYRGADQRDDSTDTTALPAMRPRERAAEPTGATTAMPDTSGDDAHTTALPREEVAAGTPPRGGDGDSTASMPAHTDPADAAPSHADPADAAPSHADPADAAPSNADPAPPAAGSQDPAQQTQQFPRPPDDEDLDPENR